MCGVMERESEAGLQPARDAFWAGYPGRCRWAGMNEAFGLALAVFLAQGGRGFNAGAAGVEPGR